MRLAASRVKGHPMRRGKAPFDPKIFLAKVGEGKKVSDYRKDQIIFSQGEIADAVYRAKAD
jgi:CRP/FNR family transcriptional regulator, cyclic AMP receptor protein